MTVYQILYSYSTIIHSFGEKENSTIIYFNMQMHSKVISFTLNVLLPNNFHGPPDIVNEKVIQNKNV